MPKKLTKYRCLNCGNELYYAELEKIKTMTVNKKVEHYLHRCPQCKERHFAITSTVMRL